jgi:serine O-acetyltransferase
MSAPPSEVRPITLARMFSDIRSDFVRLAQAMSVPLTVRRVVFSAVSPTIVALTLYRISRYLYCRGLRSGAWLCYNFNCFLTGADIAPSTSIGRSCLLGHANGMILCGRIGDNATLYARAGMGGGRQGGDIGGGAGLPVLEDNVTVSACSSILGPIRIGHGATIGPHTLILDDVPPGVTVLTHHRLVTRTNASPE